MDLIYRALIFAVFLFIFTAVQIFAETSPGEEGIKTATELQLQISSLPEAKFVFNQSFIFPFLQSSNPLTKDNNVTARLSAELSPLSLNGVGEINWTPAAFFVLSGGGRAGSGWNIPLGNGIGLNKPVGAYSGDPRESDINGSAFDGLLWAAWGAGTLQFDLGAVIPGDWIHVLFQTRHEFCYTGYTRAGSGESWVFENDEAENQNGWVYYANLVLGYQMPRSPVLETVAFMAELTTPLYATPGDTFNRWTFSGLFNLTFTPRFSTALIIQMRTQRSYDRTIMDTGNYYPDYAKGYGEGENVLLFYRAAAILSYKIR